MKYTIRIIDNKAYDICANGIVIKSLRGNFATLRNAAELVQVLADTTQKCEKNGDTFEMVTQKK